MSQKSRVAVETEPHRQRQTGPCVLHSCHAPPTDFGY